MDHRHSVAPSKEQYYSIIVKKMFFFFLFFCFIRYFLCKIERNHRNSDHCIFFTIFTTRIIIVRIRPPSRKKILTRNEIVLMESKVFLVCSEKSPQGYGKG
jgi:phosphate starvation-inducible membrane PsiE